VDRRAPGLLSSVLGRPQAAAIRQDDKDYGSLTPGKVADVSIVDGKPAEHGSDLRTVEHVIRGGRLFDIHDLKVATGSVRP